MQEESDRQIPGLEEVSRHHHLCLLYEGDSEILTPVVPFIQKGLALGERCLYLNAGEDTLERVLKNAVSGQKHDVGALKLLPVQDTWLKGGSFHPAGVLELLAALNAEALGDGFKATRIICEMGWAGREAKTMDLLMQFEVALNSFAEEHETTVLCLYDRRAFPPERLLELAKLHPHLVIAGKVCSNPLYVPHDRDVRVSRASYELDLFLAQARSAATAAADYAKLKQELEQAYAALARKIYENWQEEDSLKASEKELHEKDEALLQHRRRLQTILQHLPAIMVAFDGNGAVAACNHEFERITGYLPEEVMGRKITDLFQLSGDQQDELVAAHPEEGGSYRGLEWDLKCRDGSAKKVSWSNISRYVPIPGWVNWIMGLDITSQVRAELGMRSLTSELDARTSELEAFGLAVSHDLSGRLSKISSHCSIMQERYGVALTPQCRELLRSINEATMEMVGRINALQRFAALSSDGLQPEEVDLSAMASEIAARLRGTGERSVTFRIEDGVTAKGDPKLLRLAMEQLLENAWNYTAGVQHPVIGFGTAEVEGEKSFFVSDNGPRMESAVAGAPPVRTPAKPEHLCCGIGLATVQRIITLHRGRIWAADQADKGGTLYFTV